MHDGHTKDDVQTPDHLSVRLGYKAHKGIASRSEQLSKDPR